MTARRARGRPAPLLALLALLTLAGCAGGPSPARPDEAVPLQLEDRQIIVAVPLVTPGLRSEVQRRLARQYDLEAVGAFPLTSIDVHCMVFEVPPGRPMDRVVAELASHPGVELVQRNQRFEGLGEAADPYASFQHGAEAMHAPEAHRWVTGRGVRVAVVDTGVDTRHPDLAGRIVTARNFVQGGERSFREDVHGTAVAGVIAARARNGEGIYGIAPDSELVVAKACWPLAGSGDRALCSSWTLARAIDFALGAEIRVLNLSLAGPEDRLLRRLLAAGDEAGVVVAAAAGRDARGPAFPASLGTVIAVAAYDVAGEQPEAPWGAGSGALAAPGHEILTTSPGAAYRFVSGSSLSTAHVSGGVALLLEQEPGLSPADVRELLGATARPEPGAEGGGLRRVDVCAALHSLRPEASCP